MNRESNEQGQVSSSRNELVHKLAQLRPFVSPRKDALLDAIRVFWQLPNELHLSFVTVDQHPSDFPTNAILVRVEAAGTRQRWEVSLRLSTPPDPTFSMQHVSGSTGIMRLLQANVSTGVSASAKAELKQAWTDFFPFRMMRDLQYREIYTTHQDVSGRIRLGYRCNQDCWFCWQGRQWPSPPEEYYVGWIDQMADLGVTSLNITGGEPTTYSNLPALITKASGYGMTVSIQSNAIKLGRKEYLQNLVQEGLDFVMVSYHSADSEQSDLMTRAPKTHQRTKQGIANLADLGVPFSLNCVVERTNLEGLPALAADIVERFVKPFPNCQLKRVSFSHPFEYYEGGWSEAVVTVEEAKPHLVDACRTLHDAGIPFQVTGTCGFPLCIFSNDSDLLETQRVLGLDYDDSEVSHRIFAKPCEQCDVKPSCHGIRRVYRERFGDPAVTPIKLK